MNLTKTLFTLLALGFLTSPMLAQNQPFITTWKTENPGFSCNSCITIPTTGGGYNYDVDWDNDGVFDEFGITGNVTHDFGAPGTYTIRIQGAFPRIYFNDTGDRTKILSIDQWGDIAWSSMQRAFHGALNLTYNATDAPDLSNVTNMGQMFERTFKFNGDLNNWDVQNVTNMGRMFANAIKFNGDISNWNVQNVRNMSFMFRTARSFNQDISNWNVQKVTNMLNMFLHANSFNQNLGNWNVQKVTNMSSMFSLSDMNVFNYDQTLIGWASQAVKPNVPLGATGRRYCLAEEARNTLINTHGWTITGDQLDCCPYTQPPIAACQNLVKDADANCEAMASAEEFDNGSSDPDEEDILSFSVEPEGPYAVGVTTVTLTVSDPCGKSSQCTATITVVDNTDPSITCPPGFSQTNDPGDCGAVVDVPSATATDNCGVTYLKARSREVDAMGDPISGWSSFSNDPDGFYAVGRWEVQWRAKDAANNKKNCKFIFEVTDDEVPTPVCLDPIVYFNGEANIDLTAADVFDELASSDNCTDVILNNFFPTSVSCEELGSIIPVTVSVSDENGNGTSCTAFVTVDGLPCGWSANPDGVGCPGGNNPSYDPNAETFTISSDGCYDPNYYSNSDSQGFVGTTLCGDGEIIAHVTQVSGDGFAGVSMREDLSPGSKMLQLGIDGVFITERKMRQSTGGLAYKHQFQTQGKTWLRLTRSGNQFTAQHSTDGMNWSSVIIVNIPMGSCIQVGLYTENNNASGTTTATFEEVDIKSGVAPLSAPELPDVLAVDHQLERDIKIYPNPARNESWIDLGNSMGQRIDITVFDNLGRLVQRVPASAIEHGLVRLDTHDWENGLYLIKVTIDEGEVVTRRLIRN